MIKGKIKTCSVKNRTFYIPREEFSELPANYSYLSKLAFLEGLVKKKSVIT